MFARGDSGRGALEPRSSSIGKREAILFMRQNGVLAVAINGFGMVMVDAFRNRSLGEDHNEEEL
jgi:hypothetical protein